MLGKELVIVKLAMWLQEMGQVVKSKKDQEKGKGQEMQLEKMPPALRDMWLSTGQENFERFVADLRR